MKDIAVLRKAGFSIQEIMKMQNSADKINFFVETKCSELEEICDTYQQSIAVLNKEGEKIKKKPLLWQSILPK